MKILSLLNTLQSLRFFSIIFFMISIAHAQEGTYAGSQQNSKYSAVVSIQAIEDVQDSGIFRIVGQFGFLKRGTNKLTKVKFDGVQAGAVGFASSKGFVSQIKFKDSQGQTQKVEITGYYNAWSESYTINLPKKVFGGFALTIKANGPSKVDLSGSWQFSDGTFVAIDKSAPGQFEAHWIGANGHVNLRGNMIGKFQNGIWKGAWHVSEESVLVQGNYILNYDVTGIKLEGKVTTTSNLNPVKQTSNILIHKLSN